MKKTLFIAAVALALTACSNENFKTYTDATVPTESIKHHVPEEQKKLEMIEGLNLKKFGASMASIGSGVYSLCMENKKHYFVKNANHAELQLALDYFEKPIECTNEGEFKNVLNGIESGIFTYCSAEEVKYNIINISSSFSFYPVRNHKFALENCQRKNTL